MTTMFGGQGQGPTPESRTLTAISESPNPDTADYASAEKVAELLQRHDYQIKALATGQQQLQKGVNDATQNPLQQMQQFVSDIIVLLGGGQLVEGTLDFGDLQYILPALGALFGFGDGPFPINLFNAAEKFFLGYVVPGQQFADVVNNIIGGWMNLFGFDPKFIKDLKALITSIGDLFGGIENLFTGLDGLFGALGMSGGDLGPLGQLLAPILKLFTGVDLKNVGSFLEFITAAIDPFVQDLTAVINFINEVLAIVGFTGSGGVVNSPLGDATSPIAQLMDFLTSFIGIFGFSSADGGTGLGLGNLLSLPATFLNDTLSLLGLGSISDSADPFANILALPQHIIDTFLGFLSGGTLGAGGIGDLTGLLDNIPLIGPLIAGLGGSGTGVEGLIQALLALPEELISTFIGFLTGGTTTTGGLDILQPLLDNIPLVGPLIEALTGGNIAGAAATLPNLANFFDIGTGFDSIVAFIESVVGSIPIVGPLIDTFLTFLTGSTSSGGTLGDLSSSLDNIPLIGPLLQALTGSSTTGGGGLLGLGTVFTDLFGLLGNPAGLGTGAPTLAADLSTIPIIGPIVSSLFSFLSGGTTTSGGADALSSLLSNIPLVGPLIAAFTGSATTGGGAFAGLSQVIHDFMGIFGNISGLGTGSVTVDSILSNIPVLGPFLSWLQPVIAPLEPIIDPILGIFSMFGIGGGSSGAFDPMSAIATLIESFINPNTNLLSGFTNVLTSLTQIPTWLLGGLIPGGAKNLVPDPFFKDSGALAGLDIWSWVTSHPVTDLDGQAVPSDAGSYRVLASSTPQQIQSVPFAIPDVTQDANTAITAGIKAAWAGLAGAGQKVIVAIDSYTGLNSDGTLIEPPITDPNRVIASYSGTATNSAGSAGADANGFVPLSGGWAPPAGAKYATLSLEITENATAGTINFGTPSFKIPNILDASTLGNITQIPNLLTSSINGFSGLVDMVETFGHMIDGLGTAFSSTSQAGLSFPDLFNLATTTAQNAIAAGSASTSALGILGHRTNKSLQVGLDPTSEATVNILNADTATTVATGTSIVAFQNIMEAATKGFFEFYGLKTSGTGIVCNVYEVDRTTNVKTRVWTSGDISSQVPTGAAGYIRILIPGASQPAVAAGDLIMHEIVNNSGANMTVYTKASGKANNPNTVPSNFGGVRSSLTKGTAPASLLDSDITYNGTLAHVNFGIANVPANYHAAQIWPYMPPATTGAAPPAGPTWAWTPPSWLSTGDFIDLIGVGGAGSGSSSQWGDPTGLSQGGRAGNWNAVRLQIGTDIKLGSIITITAGTAGTRCSFYGQDGNPGASTTFTWTKPDNSTGTLTCTGGPGGSASYVADNTGIGAGLYMFQGIPYQAGGNVRGTTIGSLPAGGGGGGNWPYTFGAAGSDGAGWVRGQQNI